MTHPQEIDGELPAPLLERALADADASARDAAARLWAWFGLASGPPAWTAAEREAVRRAIAATAPQLRDPAAAGRLRVGLRRVSAARWADRLCGELTAAEEAVWVRALGDRYDAVRRCCAPRSTWRAGRISDLLARDPRTAAVLRGRIERWMTSSWELAELPRELEAAFVHGRVPPRLA